MSDEDRIFPPSLNIGDRVRVVAPASSYPESLLQRAIDFWRKEFGLELSLCTSLSESDDYLAGSDETRLNAWQEALDDPHTQAVMAVRGGYGCSRIVDHLNWDRFRKRPKIVCGFSDVTVLLNDQFQKAGVVAFHGLMPATEAGASPNALEKEMFKSALFKNKPLSFDQGVLKKEVHLDWIKDGEAEGILVGGCLSLLNASLGTAHEIQLQDRIVFLEDTGEDPYQVDRYLTQLMQVGALDHCRGILFGSFNSRGNNFSISRREEYRRAIKRSLKDFQGFIVEGFPVGHGDQQGTIPIGVRVRVEKKNAHEVSFSFLESATNG
jgi:muramoyltetrapeptide carboxypeptidase